MPKPKNKDKKGNTYNLNIIMFYMSILNTFFILNSKHIIIIYI